MGDPKDKKEEKKSLIELMDDTLFELNELLVSLKDQLASEANYSKGGANNSTVDVQSIMKDIAVIEKQIGYIEDSKEQCQIALEQIEDERKRKEMEETLKGVLIVGAINEFTRKRIEMEQERELEVIKYLTTEPEEKVIKSIFENKNYKYVTTDDVETIKQDEELNEMALIDPYKYEKEALAHKDRYERMMGRYLWQNGVRTEDTFEAKEKAFIELLKKSNAFEKNVKLINGVIEQNMNQIKDGLTKEEFKTFEEICEGIKELAKITRIRQDEFITGKSSFKNGNGYTEKLIQKENDVYSKITKLKNDLDEKHAKEQDDVKRDKMAFPIIYITMFADPIRLQCEMDAVFLESKGIRKREEMWDVFKNLPDNYGNVRASIRKISRAQSIASTKGKRIEDRGRLKGGYLFEYAKWAGEASDNISVAVADRKKKLTKKEIDDVKGYIAEIVLNQILYNEDEAYAMGEDAPNRRIMIDGGMAEMKHNFKTMARTLAGMPAFESAFKKIKGKRVEDKIAYFLSNDVEKDIARTFKGKTIIDFQAKKKVNKAKRLTQKTPN